jgi:hypothetical protein
MSGGGKKKKGYKTRERSYIISKDFNKGKSKDKNNYKR